MPSIPHLPAEARVIAEQIVGHQLLGASRAVRLINDVLVALAEHDDSDSGPVLAQRIRTTSDFFIAVRGQTTPVVANAMDWLLDGLDGVTASGHAAVQTWIAERRRAFNDRSIANVATIAEVGANLLANVETVFVYDYSSSVMAVLRRTAERGRSLRLLVPESRSINGGRPIVREALAMGHSVEYFVDSAFAEFVPRARACLVGAETVLADGSFLTTPGTYPLAVMCDLYKVPFYVPTELIKIDRRTYQGIVRPIGTNDDIDVLDPAGELRALGTISFTAPKLDRTPARYTTAYITEIGVMPPELIWEVGRQLLSRGNTL